MTIQRSRRGSLLFTELTAAMVLLAAFGGIAVNQLFVDAWARRLAVEAADRDRAQNWLARARAGQVLALPNGWSVKLTRIDAEYELVELEWPRAHGPTQTSSRLSTIRPIRNQGAGATP